jgi:filamentous hemagglutinin family protein
MSIRSAAKSPPWRYPLLASKLLGIVAVIGLFSTAHAQVTTNITSSGLGTAINGSTSAPCLGVTCTITGGDRRGQNLFHSFGLFNIGAGNTANFSNDSGLATSNIVGRVTGGQTSNIFGIIQTTNFGAANLFLMNPFGWIFGPTARLNVGGSFHATTADYIKLGVDGTFYADPAKASVLTSANPTAFGFLNPAPAPINVVTPAPGVLRVPVNGQTLSLVGGTVNVGATDGSTPGYVLAQAGRVNLVSVASPGEAAFDGTGFNVDGFTKLGDINLRGRSIVDGKEVFIRGGRLVIDNSLIMPGAFAFLGAPGVPAPNGGEVNIKVTNDVTVTGTALEPRTQAPPGILVFNGAFGSIAQTAKVPDVRIDAGSVNLSGLTSIQTDRLGPGDPGNILINAPNVQVSNGSSIGLFNFFQGSGGNLTINAQEVELVGAPNVSTGLAAQATFHPIYGNSFNPVLTFADGGSITVNAARMLSISGGATIGTESSGFGRGGDISVNAGNVSLVGTGTRGAITSQSLLAGDAGNISMNATGRVEIRDVFQITANTGGSGNGGIVNLTAGDSVTMTGANSRVLSGTLQVPDQQLDSFAQRFDNFFRITRGMRTQTYAALRTALGVTPGLGDLMQVLMKLNAITAGGNRLVAVTDFTPGDAGRISFTTPLLTMNADTRIEASTGSAGNAGAIVANVNSLFLNDGASIRNRSGIQLLSGGFAIGTGNAGTVNINATDTISVSGHSPTSGASSAITTTTLGNGNAGNISLSANQVNVQNGGSISSASGETFSGQLFVGTGNAGQITVSTPTLTMGDGGTVSVATLGAGNAGNVLLNVNNFTQSGGARVDSSTSGAGSGGDITVTAANSASISGAGTGLFSTASSTGAGGDVNVQAPQVQILDGATISANSTGTATATAGNVNVVTSNLNMQTGSITTESTLADGGNISITTTGSIVHLTDSEITTSVESGSGSGGNITIDSDLVVLDNSRILANAFGGPGGNINITADVFLVNSGGTLPTSLAGIVDASSALSTPGTINIQATFTDVTGEVAQLPETPLRATELLRAACAARFAGGRTSSLVLGGRDGVPLQPGGLMPSPLYLASEADAPAAGTKISGQDLPLRFSLLGSSDPRLTQYSLLPNAKCAF